MPPLVNSLGIFVVSSKIPTPTFGKSPARPGAASGPVVRGDVTPSWAGLRVPPFDGWAHQRKDRSHGGRRWRVWSRFDFRKVLFLAVSSRRPQLGFFSPPAGPRHAGSPFSLILAPFSRPPPVGLKSLVLTELRSLREALRTLVPLSLPGPALGFPISPSLSRWTLAPCIVYGVEAVVGSTGVVLKCASV